ncbi:TRAP transporter small permease [Roseibium polysiphoniae]|uniref:TRAP transporter small permease protein n=1 Tax=Roseibium polysiphoniae TaxID=2571221 RepID=A0A944CEJ6_9HYPH|nr:TRAP transporter small permease [Roseibium polysiphoniae]MBS8261614.1 TRAP transporter small permease [Roseibium polysiphoniae]
MSRLGRFIDAAEENFIAAILALMTLVTFSQVVARYGFNSGWGGALEFTRVLFAWLILFGMSYGIKIGAHLGVDAVIRLLPKPLFRIAALLGAGLTVLYAALLFDASWFGTLFGLENKGSTGGAYAYVAKFYKLPIGMEDLKWPLWVQETFEVRERVPRWMPYVILPIGLVLLGFRAAQAFWMIVTGQKDSMIAAHEAEELVAENKDALKD